MWVLIGYFSQQDTLYLIGVWLGEDWMTNTINTHDQKRLPYIFQYAEVFHTQQWSQSRRIYVFDLEINKHALPINLQNFHFKG